MDKFVFLTKLNKAELILKKNMTGIKRQSGLNISQRCYSYSKDDFQHIPREAIISAMKKSELNDRNVVFQRVIELSDEQIKNMFSYIVGEKAYKTDMSKIIGMWDTSRSKSGMEGILITKDTVYYKVKSGRLWGSMFKGEITLNELFSVERKNQLNEDYFILKYKNSNIRSISLPVFCGEKIEKFLQEIIYANFLYNQLLEEKKDSYRLLDKVWREMSPKCWWHIWNLLQEREKTVTGVEKYRIQFVSALMCVRSNNKVGYLSRIQLAAEGGYEKAQNNMGKHLENSNKSKAIEWYIKAAEQGDPIAQYNLANCLDDDYVIEKEKLYMISSKQGCILSEDKVHREKLVSELLKKPLDEHEQLLTMLENTTDVKKVKTMVDVLEKRALSEYSLYKVLEMYCKGNSDVLIDGKNAKYYREKWIDGFINSENDSNALIKYLYTTKDSYGIVNAVKKLEKLAYDKEFEVYKKLSEFFGLNGNRWLFVHDEFLKQRTALYYEKKYYEAKKIQNPIENGIEMYKDFMEKGMEKKAENELNEVIQVANQKRTPKAYNNVAKFYFEKQDFAHAFEWYSKSAELFDVEGLCMKGYFYQTGKHVEKNREVAKYYFEAAVRLDEQKASELAKELRKYSISSCNVINEMISSK